MAKKYTKVTPITAEQWTGSQEMADKYNLHMSPRGYSILPTLEGDMRLDYGDYIATGIKGEHWAIDEKIFEATYKETENTADQKHYADKLSEFYSFSGQQIINLLNEAVYSGLTVKEVIEAMEDYDMNKTELVQLQEDNKTLRFVLDQRRRHND